MNIITEKMIAGGNCIARINGKIIFIPYALPGEGLAIELFEEKKDYMRASITSIIDPSPFRIEPLCPLFKTCGGCNLQMASYDHQLVLKKNIIIESLQRAGLSFIPDIKTFYDTPTSYRSRFQFHVNKIGTPSLKKEKSNELVAIPNCPIAHPLIQDALQSKDLEKHIKTHHITDRFICFASDKNVFVEHIHNDVQTKILDTMLNFNVKGFFQSNISMLETLVKNILTIISKENKNCLLDFYAGVGTFSTFLAPFFQEIVLVEHNKQALTYAKSNVKETKIKLCPISDEAWPHAKEATLSYDCAIIDPPRQGLSKNALAWFSKTQIPMLIYVSCDPTSFARDATQLCAHSYSLKELHFYDFYPQTHHIELMGLFVL